MIDNPNTTNDDASVLKETEELWRKINDKKDQGNRGWAVDRIRANLAMLKQPLSVLDKSKSADEIREILDAIPSAKADGRGMGL